MSSVQKPNDADAANVPGPQAQFVEDESALAEAIARFVLDGLAAGKPVIVIATEARRAALLKTLGQSGFAELVSHQSTVCLLLDARETLAELMVGDMPEWRRFKQSVGDRLERFVGEDAKEAWLYGELGDLLWRGGNPQAAIRLDEMFADLAKSLPFSLVRAYTLGGFYRHPSASQLHRVPVETTDATADLRLEMERWKQRALLLEKEIAHRHEFEEALRRAAVEADRATVRRDAFIAMLGHELRNPLASILTALELMRMRADASSERERSILERQARHMAQLVDDMLDVARVASGKLELRKAPIEIASAVARAVEMTSKIYEEKRHALSVDVPQNLIVDGDATRLAQIFANILGNAAKYTDAGGRVDVSAVRDGGTIVVTIRDSGVGIAREILAQIFDPFVQAESSHGRDGGGLGLGLAIVRMLVKLHDGLVTVASEGQGKGSTFTVRLPAATSR